MQITHQNHKKIPEQVPSEPSDEIDFAALERAHTIGTGGTANVIKMTNVETGMIAAVKQPRLNETLNNRVANEFVNEAETWQKIDDHAHIVGVIDWEKTPVPRIALEYMDSGSLADRIGEIQIEQALWIGACVADAVLGAHRRGVAHLDLKPANILFRTTEESEWDVPKVSDWGLAKMLLHHSQDISGLSPQYSAPEQFDQNTYGQPTWATDIYQLGVVVYEILTGDPLFAGQPTTVMNKHLTEQPTLPTVAESTLPAAVDDILRTALAKRPDERYESMLDFRRDLEALFFQVAIDDDTSFVCQRHSTNTRDTIAQSEQTRSDQSNKTLNETEYSDVFGETASTNDSGPSGILDNIREDHNSNSNRQFPWQRRDAPPGLNEDIDADLQRRRHGISTQTTKRLQDISGEESDDGDVSTVSEDGFISLIWRLLQRF